MRLVAAALSLVLAASLAQATPAPAEEKFPVDVSAAKAQMTVIHDGKGHYLALVPREDRFQALKNAVFYGDGKELFRLRQISFSASPGQRSYSFVEGRVPPPGVQLFYDAKRGYRVQCNKTEVSFAELEADKRKALLDQARFFEARRQRSGYALARDERGNYYFVDRSLREDRKRDFQLYVGKPGRMKRQRMKNIVSDSAGDIFSTPRGTLRLVLNKEPKEALWIRGKRRTKLIQLPLFPNRELIFNDLGVYAGERFGTPCDDI